MSTSTTRKKNPGERTTFRAPQYITPSTLPGETPFDDVASYEQQLENLIGIIQPVLPDDVSVRADTYEDSWRILYLAVYRDDVLGLDVVGIPVHEEITEGEDVETEVEDLDVQSQATWVVELGLRLVEDRRARVRQQLAAALA